MRFIAASALLLLSTAGPADIAIPSAHAQEPARAVVVTGLGKDARSALQNAAENALTQVSGTFVRTDTTIERTNEIRGAIRSETRRIDTKLSEYAQGTISSIQVLSTSQEGATTRVEARVSVRLSELKAFIESIDVGTGTVSAEVTINSSLYQRRAVSAEDIFLDTVLRPIFTGTAVRYSLGSPFSIRDISSYVLSESGNSSLRSIVQRYPARMVAIPVNTFVEPFHVANSIQSLGAISIRSHNCDSDNFSHFAIKTDKSINCFRVRDIEAGDQSMSGEELPLRQKLLSSILANGYHFDENVREIKHRLDISFKNSDNQIIFTKKISGCYSYYDQLPFSSDDVLAVAISPDAAGLNCFLPIAQFPVRFPSRVPGTQKNVFLLIVDGTSEWFQQTKNISVQLEGVVPWK